RNGNFDILSKPATRDGEPRVLVSTPADEQAPDWSPDRRFLIYTSSSPGAKIQLVYRERHADGILGDPVAFAKSPFNENLPRFSPDGRFVAYVSDESGKGEVYVREFPSGANKRQISTDGGTLPRWSRNGKEIFYSGGRHLFSASVATEPAFLSRPP